MENPLSIYHLGYLLGLNAAYDGKGYNGITREEVDVWHKHLQEKNVKMNREPQYTAQYKIYNGFYSDPSGYTIEIQAFDKESQPIGHDSFSK